MQVLKNSVIGPILPFVSLDPCAEWKNSTSILSLFNIWSMHSTINDDLDKQLFLIVYILLYGLFYSYFDFTDLPDLPVY